MTRLLPCALAAALTLAACAPQPPASASLPGVCMSPCGVVLTGSFDCVGFLASEGRAIAALEAKAGFPSSLACANLEGFVVHIRNPGEEGAGSWYSKGHGYDISGLCSCNHKYIELATDDWRANSHTHEIAHAAEGCFDHDHLSWAVRGIYRAVAESHKAP